MTRIDKLQPPTSKVVDAPSPSKPKQSVAFDGSATRDGECERKHAASMMESV